MGDGIVDLRKQPPELHEQPTPVVGNTFRERHSTVRNTYWISLPVAGPRFRNQGRIGIATKPDQTGADSRRSWCCWRATKPARLAMVATSSSGSTGFAMCAW